MAGLEFLQRPQAPPVHLTEVRGGVAPRDGRPGRRFLPGPAATGALAAPHFVDNGGAIIPIAKVCLVFRGNAWAASQPTPSAATHRERAPDRALRPVRNRQRLHAARETQHFTNSRHPCLGSRDRSFSKRSSGASTASLLTWTVRTR